MRWNETTVEEDLALLTLQLPLHRRAKTLSLIYERREDRGGIYASAGLGMVAR